MFVVFFPTLIISMIATNSYEYITSQIGITYTSPEYHLLPANTSFSHEAHTESRAEYRIRSDNDNKQCELCFQSAFHSIRQNVYICPKY